MINIPWYQIVTPGSTISHRHCRDQYIHLSACSGPPNTNYLRTQAIYNSMQPPRARANSSACTLTAGMWTRDHTPAPRQATSHRAHPRIPPQGWLFQGLRVSPCNVIRTAFIRRILYGVRNTSISGKSRIRIVSRIRRIRIYLTYIYAVYNHM
jgi:hypothetical protein